MLLFLPIERLPPDPVHSRYSLLASEPKQIRRNKGWSGRNTENVWRLRRVKWTKEEEGYLIKGVKKYGKGRWKLIINSYPFNPRRTPVDAKDKWRNMEKRNS